MPTICVLFGSALVLQTLINLRCTLLLVFDSKLELLYLLLQGLVLHMEVVDEFLDVDALVTRFVHSLEKLRDDLIKTLTQVCLLSRGHGGIRVA